MDSISRRRLLELTSAGAVVGTAGCSDIISGSESTTPQSSNSSGASRAELQSRITELQNRVESLQDEVSTKDQRIESLQQDLKALEAESKQQNQTIDSLRTDLSEAEARIEELESRSGGYQYSAEVREAATNVGQKLREAVVVLEFDLGGGYTATGTGWFIDQNHIITNRHVVRDVTGGNVDSKTGYLLDGTRFDFSVKNTAEDDDVALIETNTEAPYIPPRGDASSLSSGQPLVQVGHPGVIGNWVISLGEYIKESEYSNAIWAEIPSTSGNSGSPLITLDGDVVGLTYGGTSREGYSESSIPSEEGALEEYPYQESNYSQHDTIGTVEEYYEQWTGN